MMRQLPLLLIVGLAAGSLCACANERTSVQKTAPETAPRADAQIAERNNAASLLANLLGDEKNLSKLLIIKGNTEELGKLVKELSKTAGAGSDQLEKLAKQDKTLDLHAERLPPGEKAAREAESKTSEYRLLHSSGRAFELNVLLTQIQALDYGAHLAKIAADTSSSPEEAREFHALNIQLNNLYDQAVGKLRATTK
jgi:hypothetical protein